MESNNDKIISDRNIKAAMRTKPLSEILRGWFVYKLFTFDKIVENSDSLTKFAQKVFGKRMFEKLMKMTIYGLLLQVKKIGEILHQLDCFLD